MNINELYYRQTMGEDSEPVCSSEVVLASAAKVQQVSVLNLGL